MSTRKLANGGYTKNNLSCPDMEKCYWDQYGMTSPTVHDDGENSGR